MYLMEKAEKDREIRRFVDKADSLKNCFVRTAKSEIPIKELVGKINMMGGKTAVQVFDPDAVISEAHLKAAYLNAMLAFDEGRNISRTMMMEILLFASMQRKIDEAVRISGAKSEKGFVLFCGNGSLYERVKPLVVAPVLPRFSKAHSTAAAHVLGLRGIDIGEIMEGMAASRVD